jgi:hypothetical protein
LLQIMETPLTPRKVWLMVLLNADNYLPSSENKFFHSSKICVPILRKHFSNMMGLNHMQQMQCWMFAISIFMIKFRLIDSLHISGMVSPGQCAHQISTHFNISSWDFLNASAEVKEWVEPYLHSPNTPSWSGARLKKAQRQLYLYLSVYRNSLHMIQELE